MEDKINKKNVEQRSEKNDREQAMELLLRSFCQGPPTFSTSYSLSATVGYYLI